MTNKLLRLPHVLELRGKSRSAHYDDIQKGLMTPPVNLGGRSVGWPEREISAINAALIAGKSESEIKELVRKLVSDRKSLCEVAA
ncbi:MAG: AlpA family phage regulatory protein [Nitrosomonadaceae bacterium]|nr:AlpA family phage regulatory protein [Nitrosomonadaceae bacterium]